MMMTLAYFLAALAILLLVLESDLATLGAGFLVALALETARAAGEQA